MLLHHETQQYKQNLTKLNYAYGYVSVKYVWSYPKTTISDLNKQKEISGKIWECTQKPKFRSVAGKTSSMV